jgi:cobalt-zinc-cadmium efflux system outer membrane protein
MKSINRWRIQRITFVAFCVLGLITSSVRKTLSEESIDQHAPLTAERGPLTNRGSESEGALSSLVNEALLRSPIIAAARAHWQASTKVPQQVSTIPDPQVSFQQLTVGGPKPFEGYESSDFYYSGFGFMQDIPGPGKLHLRAQQAEKDAEAARLTFETQRRQVAEQVRETYFNLFYLQKAKDLLHQTHEQLQRVERTSDSQYQLGMSQQQDVLKAQLELTSLLSEIAMNDEQYSQAQAGLKGLLGREQDSPDVPIGEVSASVVKAEDAGLRELASKSSPVLRRALAMEQKSDVALSLAKKDYIPDFSVGYMYQKRGPGFSDLYQLTVGATIPLYFWRKQTPAVEQAALEKEAAHAETYASRLSTMSDLQSQIIGLETTTRIISVYENGLIPQSRATQSSAFNSYRVGKSDFQTLLSSIVDVLRLQQEYYRALADHEIAIAKIKQIVGENI